MKRAALLVGIIIVIYAAVEGGWWLVRQNPMWLIPVTETPAGVELYYRAFDFRLTLPTGWTVEADKPSRSAGLIPRTVRAQSPDGTRHVSIVRDPNSILIQGAPVTKTIMFGAEERTAYIFPKGYECGMHSPGATSEQCSHFVVLFERSGRQLALYASGHAADIVEPYISIFASYTPDN